MAWQQIRVKAAAACKQAGAGVGLAEPVRRIGIFEQIFYRSLSKGISASRDYLASQTTGKLALQRA